MNYRELIKLQKPPELIKIRTVTISEINNKSEHIHGDESVRIIGYWLPLLDLNQWHHD